MPDRTAEPAARTAIGADAAVPLRPVRDGDSAALIALIGGCWSEYPGCVLDIDGEEPWLRRPATALAESGARLWVVPGGPGITASVGMRPHAADTMELKSLYVAAPYRRRGLASALLAFVEDRALRHRAAAVVAFSDSRFHQAHALYARRGYHRTGVSRELHDLSNTVEYEFVKRLDPTDGDRPR